MLRHNRGAREKLLAAATHLFYSQGINSTGIDAVISSAGVAKASLYNNFSSKDKLVGAYLQHMQEAWLAESSRVDNPKASPVDRITALFSSLESKASSASFHGCPFASAVAELPENREVKDSVRKYRKAVLEHVARIVDLDPSSDLVLKLVLLYDGAMITAKFTHQKAGIAIARKMAVELVRN